MQNETKRELLRVIVDLFVENIQHDVLWKQRLPLQVQRKIDEVDVAFYGLQKMLGRLDDE